MKFVGLFVVVAFATFVHCQPPKEVPVQQAPAPTRDPRAVEVTRLAVAALAVTVPAVVILGDMLNRNHRFDRAAMGIPQPVPAERLTAMSTAATIVERDDKDQAMFEMKNNGTIALDKGENKTMEAEPGTTGNGTTGNGTDVATAEWPCTPMFEFGDYLKGFLYAILRMLALVFGLALIVIFGVAIIAGCVNFCKECCR